MEVLDRVDGRREWSVKVVLPPPPPRAVPASEPTTGTEFLRRRQAETGDRADQQEEAARLAREIHADLTALGEASRLLPPQDPQLTGHSGAMVLNGAYLVPRSDEDRFAHRVAELEARHGGVLVETGGPWPPYSFAVLEQT